MGRVGGANPYTVHAEVQQTMSDLVGIIRREEEIKTALTRLDKLRERAANVSAPGGSAYDPGWHLALDLRNILLIAECVALAALERQESRGGNTRDYYPAMSPESRKVNLVCSLDGAGRVVLWRQPIPPIRPDLLALFDVAEVKKYMTSEELARLPGAAEIYGVPGRDVALVTGATSRDKVIEIAGPPAPLTRRLGQLLDT